jgi:hypothetical protein
VLVLLHGSYDCANTWELWAPRLSRCSRDKHNERRDQLFRAFVSRDRAAVREPQVDGARSHQTRRAEAAISMSERSPGDSSLAVRLAGASGASCACVG